MKFLLFNILQIICMIICYLTNWIVVLFADEEGNLPGILKYWQTWDDTIDNKGFIDNHFPKIFWYDWDKHYKQYIGPISGNRIRYYQELTVPLTTTEKIKRYFCRVGWLTRNCGYGFAYYIFGITFDPSKIKYIENKNGMYLLYQSGSGLWNTRWSYKDDRYFCKYIRWCNFMGWKIDRNSKEPHRAMIATRITIRFGKRN